MTRLEPTAALQNPERVEPLRLDVDWGRVRVVLHAAAEVEGSPTVFDREGAEEAVRNWLEHGGPLLLVGIERLEVYILPEGG